MIVLDASAAIAMLVEAEPGAMVRSRLRSEDELHVPHLLDLEVLSALRRLARRGELTSTRIEQARRDLGNLGLERHRHAPLCNRIWQLRDSLTPYDASYVALAEALDAPLLTCDARLAGASGHYARVELMA